MSGAGYAMIGTIVTLVVVSSFFRAGMLTAAPGQPVPIGPYMFSYVNAATLVLLIGCLYSPPASTSVSVSSINKVVQAHVPVRKLATIGVLVAPFYFLQFVLYNVSLQFTSVSDAVTASLTCPIWSYLISVFYVKDEALTVSKVVSVALSMAGVYVVSLAEGAAGSAVAPNPLLGNAMAIASAILLAFYSIIFKMRLPNPSKWELCVVLGFAGLTILLFGWMGLYPALTYTNETLDNLSQGILVKCFLHGLLYVIPMVFLFALAVALTSPLIVNSGMILTIPLSLAIDSVLAASFPPAGKLFGNALCLAGFFLLVFAPSSSVSEPKSETIA